MASTDLELGRRVEKYLIKHNLETPMHRQLVVVDSTRKLQALEEAVTDILFRLGMNLEDDSIQDTPKRVAKMYAEEIFYGLDYKNFPKCSTFLNKANVDEMVCVRNILVRSVCEHHLVPFVGVAHIAYIPNAQIIGLSKFNRVVDFFCRRPQVQERLTEQIAAALRMILATDHVAVYLDAEHMCVKLRGIQDPHSSTVTSKLLGNFKKVPELRYEFLHAIKS